jgi:hypothetical protein
MYVLFFIDIPFKGSQSHSNMRSKVTAVSYAQRSHICTAVSYMHSGVKDSTVHVTAVSMTPLCISQRSQWLCYACHSGVNDSAVHVTAVSMTPMCNQLCKFTPEIRIHIQKGFNRCIRGLRGVVWWKKQRLKISCQGPFNVDRYLQRWSSRRWDRWWPCYSSWVTSVRLTEWLT